LRNALEKKECQWVILTFEQQAAWKHQNAH